MSSLGNCQYLGKSMLESCTGGTEESMVSWKRSVGRRVGEIISHFTWGVEGILAIPFLHFLLNLECVEQKEGGCVREWPRVP